MEVFAARGPFFEMAELYDKEAELLEDDEEEDDEQIEQWKCLRPAGLSSDLFLSP